MDNNLAQEIASRLYYGDGLKRVHRSRILGEMVWSMDARIVSQYHGDAISPWATSLDDKINQRGGLFIRTARPAWKKGLGQDESRWREPALDVGCYGTAW